MGRAFVFGDGINTDVLAPGVYMKAPIEELARHCLEAVDPKFASAVRPGDVVVGGRSFGAGSSREQAAQALKHLGVTAVLAKSFGGIFYRNALNLGLVVLVCAEVDRIADGDDVSVDPRTGVITNHTRDEFYAAEPLPEFLVEMIDAGGLVPHLEAKLARQRESAQAQRP
jgi:3-isopropylmalate/(R)-2-methylmalate dehydratase small subunit